MGETFVPRLIVLEEESDFVDYIEVFCAPEGRVTGLPLRVATNVRIEHGEFVAASQDIAIEGEFVGSGRAEGTIRALSERSRACGVPDEGKWYATHQLSARRSGDGYVVEPLPD
jgi:hypothetical protein